MELEKLLSQTSLIQEIENLKNQVDALKPFPNDIEQKILQKFRLDWNYHSNAIEGNPYTYGETLTFIMHGITAKGKTMKDHFDVKGHNEGINYILNLVKDERSISESDIRALHKLILVEPYEVDTITPSGLPSKKMILIGDYKKEPNHVKTKTGEIHYYASPEDTPFLMEELIKWYNQCAENKEIHPLVTAALFHHKLTEIHPFDDGNGRMARLIMNLILLKSGFPPVVVRNEDKNNYYEALSLADAGEKRHIVEYLGNLLLHSLNIYIKGAKGESIEDESDLDKEIALFKAGLEKEDTLLEILSYNIQNRILTESVFILFSKFNEKIKQFDELFLDCSHFISISYSNSIDPIFEWNDYIKRKIFDFIDKKVLIEKICFNVIQYKYVANGYKKTRNPSNFSINITIGFNDYEYIIMSQGIEIKKMYSENLSATEINSIMSLVIKNFISFLQK